VFKCHGGRASFKIKYDDVWMGNLRRTGDLQSGLSLTSGIDLKVIGWGRVD